VRLLAADSIRYPEDIKPGSTSWQRWAIEATATSVGHGRFQGKKVIAAQPASEVFVDTIKMSEPAEGQLQNAILNHLKPKLQITPDNVLIKHVRNDSKNILVMASDRTKLYRHLAIYEKARLKVGAISVWPMAVLRAYAHLWARHMDRDNPVMLLDIGQRCTKIAICDSANLYFAHSSPVGAKGLEIDRMLDLLNSEMDMCRVKFRSAYRNPQVNHIIFVSGHAVDKDIYAEIAKRAQMSAQIGDCLDALRVPRSNQAGLRSRAPHANWITAMGLSLPEIQSARRYHTVDLGRRELVH
jgi:Tfp pilus assembly PilM family ATPase